MKLVRTLAMAMFSVGLATSPVVHGQEKPTGRLLLATVVDITGRPRIDVEADDFIVKEGTQARDVLDVHIADYPVVVLIDDSVGPALGIVKTAVNRFISRIGERPVAIGTLSNPTRMIASLDDERPQVIAAVDAVTAGTVDASQILPAVANGARILTDTGTPFSAVIVVTAHAIDTSEPARGELLPQIVDSGTTVHVIAGRVNDTGGVRDVPDLLRVLATQTHGQYTPIFASPSYSIALDRLADKLAAEVMIGYLVPANAPGGEVSVGVRRPGARVIGLGVSK